VKVKLTNSLSAIIRRPLQFIRENKPELQLNLKKGHKVLIPQMPAGFKLVAYTPEKETKLNNLLERAGIYLSKKELNIALTSCLPNGCFIIEDDHGNAISTMMGRHINSNGKLFSGRIDWLATDPDFNGLGLGTISASAAAKRLQDAGYDDIWVTTMDDRLGAIKIFYKIGFRPYIQDKTKIRWEKALKSLDLI